MTVFKGIDSTSDLDYPTVDPTLDLNFALTKTLDPRITFTRNSTATYVGSDGLIKTAVANEPRFEHDPVTGSCRGLLLEESRTNLSKQSEDFSFVGGGWTLAYGTLTTNAGIAPDGNTTADLMTQGRIERYDISYNASTTYTFSVYVKGTAGQTIGIGKLISGVDGDIILSYNTLNGSWQRFSYTFTSSVTASGRVVISGANDKSGTATNFYVWGAQLEAGSFPTSYIPTSGSTVTRAADIMSITGTNFSSWYNNTEGTFYTNAILAFTQNAGTPFTFGGVYYTNIANFGSSIRTLANLDIGLGGMSTSLTSFSKSAVALKSGDFAHGVGGNIVSTSSSSYTPAGTRVLINSSLGSKALINRLTYWNKRLPNSQLQLLTQN